MTTDNELKEHRKEVRALLKQNVKDTLTFEFWPWSQFLTTVLFLAVIIIGDPWNNRIAVAYFLLMAWAIFQLVAIYMTYKKEGT